VATAHPILARDQLVGVVVAASSNHVVQSTTILVDSIGGEGVEHKGGHGTQVGQAAPQAIVDTQVRRVQLARLARVEALGGVLQVPKVHVAHLAAFMDSDAAQVSRLHCPGASLPLGHHQRLHQIPSQSLVALILK